jgi:L-ascorbate metabolism protein UlaG (beta-lactamase superfamily)
MKTAVRVAAMALCLGALTLLLRAQTVVFTNTTRLTNREIRWQLNAPAGQSYRVDTSTNLLQWHPLLVLSNQNLHTDTAAPYLNRRFYRAQQLSGSTNITGDYLVTTNGDVLIRPIRHASFLMTWNGIVIYNDPDTHPTPLYAGLPKANLILISHEHGDHFDSSAIISLTNINCVIIAPQFVYNSMTLSLQARTTVLTNWMTTNVLGMHIQAVPAYNTNHANHPFGRGNGYIVTMGGRRVYMAGDTGPSPEMRVLPNIDVAFVPMNLQFTMSTTQAVSVVRDMRPKVVYPYHYSGSPVPDLNWFKQQVGNDLGIEVRIRNWYP